MYLGQDTSTLSPTFDITSFLTSPTPADVTTTATDTSTAAPAATDTSAPAAAAPVAATPAPTGGGWLTDLLSTVKSTVSAVTQTVQTVAPAVLSLEQQNKMAQVNAARAARGLPALTAAQYQAQYVPTPTINAGIAPATMQSLMWIAGGLVVAGLAVAMIRR